LQQLEEFEQAYGVIPEVKLVTQNNYNNLIKSLQNKQGTALSLTSGFQFSNLLVGERNLNKIF